MKRALFPWHRLKEALLRGVDVTQAYALEQGWGWRLSARVHELRKKGWPIESRYDSKGFAHYSLPRGWKPPKETTPGGAGVIGRWKQSALGDADEQ